MTSKPHKCQHEATDSMSKPEPSRADLEAALAEIEIVIGDKFPISRAVQDIIKRAKSD